MMVASLKDFSFTVSVSGNVNHRIQGKSTVAERCARKSQSCLLSIFMSVMIITSPAILFGIDETMPSQIPAAVIADWEKQDNIERGYSQAINRIISELPSEYADKVEAGSTREAYIQACHWRRVSRISRFPQMETIMFARHHNIGSIAIGFWVNCGTSDISDSHFEAKGALCLLKLENYYSQYEEILTKNNMCVKDPCISLDGKKVCFAMSPGRGRGYLLYEMEIDNPSSVKQLTEYPAGLTVADFEPCYLPNGDIMFSSTRCFGTIDCGWQPTSNMFVMNGEGKYLRRVGFDQVHTCCPVLRDDGTVLYCRWEYNDRDIANIMGMFLMYPDGCHQKEVFGNQTTWPMNMIHARAVPGNPTKFFAVASGHHGSYSGEVFVADVSENSNGPEHITMISPPRTTETRDKNDVMAMGGVYRNSEYPYPLDEEWYLVGYRDEGQESFGSISRTPYKIYLKHVDGTSQELLAEGSGSLHHPVVVAPWKDIWGSPAPRVAEYANFNDSMGSFTIQDVYVGEGMKGVKRGAAKTLRVNAIKYRVSGACDQGFAGMISGSVPPGIIFSAPNINPPSLWGASWDVKEVLGEAKIFEDGSAAFKVRAREPVYFQVLDSNGCSIASMRSWATLMPHETFSCLGCHESKNESPDPDVNPMAGKPKPLDTPLGVENRGFDFPEMVQPILDKHCVSCHKANHSSGFDLTGALSHRAANKSFANSYASLMQGIGRSTSNKAISLATIFSQAPQMSPYSFGSTQSGMIKNVLTGHNNVKLTDKEIRILACWIDLEAPHGGSYDAYMSDSDAKKYKQLEATAQKWYDIEAQNVKEWAATQEPLAVMPEGQAVAAAKHLRIGYLPTRHILVLNKVSQGTFMLVDLKGKVISRMKLSHQTTDDVTISLPASLGTGLYLAKFKGVNGIEQAKIFITQ